MTKKAICLVIMAIVLILAGSAPAHADWHRGGGPRGGGPHGGGPHGGWGRPHPHWGGFFFSPWSPWFPWYPYYPYYPYYPPYSPPAVAQQPPAYAEPYQQQSDYWYYCKNPQGYYPYVKRCPGGWTRVKPDLTPPR